MKRKIDFRDDTYLKEMGKRIRQERHKAGLSLIKLGKLSQLNYSHLSQLETGQKDPKISTLYNIAKVLNTDLKNFL